MTWKLLRLVVVGFVGCAYVAPLSGCGEGSTESTKPTIDMSTPIKTPQKPTATKVDPLPK